MYVISFVCVSVIQFEPNNLGRVIQIKPYSFMSCKLNSELLNLFQFKSLSLSLSQHKAQGLNWKGFKNWGCDL